MKDKLMDLLKRRRKRKDCYERLSNESLEKRLAFDGADMESDGDDDDNKNRLPDSILDSCTR